MTQIELHSKKESFKATIPDGWHELTFEKYLEVLKSDPIEDSLESWVKFLSIISGISVENLNRTDVKPMMWLITQLANKFSKQSLDEITKEKILQFEFKGVIYKVTKDLCAETMGEYSSLTKVEGMIAKNQWHVFPLFLAMLYRPEGEEYDHKVCEERAKEFGEIPVDVFYKARNFFLSLQQMSESVMQAYGQMNTIA